MKLSFQLLDADYSLINGKPIIKFFGKDEKGDTVCCFLENINPYFYVLPKDKNKVLSFLEKNYKNLIINIQEVERLLPLGYKEKKERLLKIIIKDPSKVRSLREVLKKKDFVSNIFESDILFKYRIMADLDLYGMRWYEVEGEAVKTTIVKTKKCLKISKIEESKEKKPKNKFLCLDIEIADCEGLPNPEKDQISIISLSFHPKFNDLESLVLISKKLNLSNTLSFENEKKMLEKFLEIVEKYDPDFIIGYNINNFDLPYILKRLEINQIPKNLSRSKKQASCRKVGHKYRNRIVGRIVVDVYEIINEYIKKGSMMKGEPLRLKRLSLGDVAKELINQEKINLGKKEIDAYWKSGKREDIERLVEYAKKDSFITLTILLEKSLLDKYIEISKVCGLLLQDVLDSGEASRVENILLREFNKKGFVILDKPSSREVEKRKKEREQKVLKGALVLEPKVGLHLEPIIYLDFKSMYPSIFIAYNICPTTLVQNDEKAIETPYGTKFVKKEKRKGIIPQIIEKLIKERDWVKKEMKIKQGWEYHLLDSKQAALKVMTNAFYGYMGYIKARFYVLDIANAITSCGRYLIEKTKKIVEDETKLEVIYGDTDSIMVKSNSKSLEETFEIGKKIANIVNKKLKGIVEMDIEHVFKSLLILTKKRYVGIATEKKGNSYEEKLIMKGIETVRRDWCDLVTKTLFKVLEIILKERNPPKAFDYVKDILIKLEKNEIPLEDLVITKSISKAIHQYKGTQPHIELVKRMQRRTSTAPNVGDRVSYVIVQGSQLISERAEDPEYVKEHNLKIDAKYYIESQIIPPLERVFEVLGYSRSQLVSIGRQLLLNHSFESKKNLENFLKNFESFCCLNCNKNYSILPLTGKCIKCEGEIVFKYGDKMSRILLH